MKNTRHQPGDVHIETAFEQTGYDPNAQSQCGRSFPAPAHDARDCSFRKSGELLELGDRDADEFCERLYAPSDRLCEGSVIFGGRVPVEVTGVVDGVFGISTATGHRSHRAHGHVPTLAARVCSGGLM